jgi:simple sugar transport system permease protein
MGILIVASLAFIFAYKAGLFNIGISGQMIVAGTVGTIISHLFNLGKGFNQIVVLLMCIIFGSLVAMLVGALKAFLNVNEVVSSIMLN